MDESIKEPGWPKLIALLVAVGIFWIWTRVDGRRRAVREGIEVNPFSPDATQVTDTTDSQVSTPTAETGTTPRKGARKWLRKG
jgi:hypothetical protein